MVVGHFPFDNATENDGWYNLIMNEKYDEYWYAQQHKNEFTFEFKDLIQKIISYNPNNRPTI